IPGPAPLGGHADDALVVPTPGEHDRLGDPPPRRADGAVSHDASLQQAADVHPRLDVPELTRRQQPAERRGSARTSGTRADQDDVLVVMAGMTEFGGDELGVVIDRAALRDW